MGHRRSNECQVIGAASLVVVALFPILAGATDPQPAARHAVEGLTWQEWSRRIKAVDPHASHSIQLVPQLIQIVESTSAPWHLRRDAGLTLGRIGKPAQTAVPRLVVLLRGEGRKNVVTADWATKSLALFGSVAASATGDLIQQLEDSTLADAQRQSSIEALAMIGRGHPNAIPPLIRLLDHGPRGAKLADANAIAHWQQLACEAIAIVGPSASPAIPSLIQASRSEHDVVRRKSLRALGVFGQASDVAIPAIMDCLIADQSAAVRDSAADALGRIGMASVPSLRHLMSDTDPEVRWRATKAIRQTGAKAADVKSELSNRLSDTDARARAEAVESLWAVTRESKLVLPTVLSDLQSTDRRIRIRAYRFLIGIGPAARPALPQLELLAKGSQRDLRQVASRVIESIQMPQPKP